MKPIVTNIIISALKGESGSNPEIYTCFPNDSGIRKDKIITYTLPNGAKTGDLYEHTYKGQDLVVIVSELQQDNTRNDVVTISLLLNDHAEKSTIISILKTIFDEFQIEKIKEIEAFTDLGKKLHSGLNRGSFIYDSYTFDIHGYLTNTGMSIERDTRKIRGGLF